MLSKRPAVTVIELVVAIGLSSVVTGIVFSALASSWKGQIINENIASLQRDARFATDEIYQRALSSSGVASSYTDAGNTTYTTTESSVIFKLPAVDSNDNLLSGTDYIVFRQKPGDPAVTERLVFAYTNSKRGSWTPQLNLIKTSQELTFTYYDSANSTVDPSLGDLSVVKKININVRASKTVYNQAITREFDRSVVFRNQS